MQKVDGIVYFVDAECVEWGQSYPCYEVDMTDMKIYYWYNDEYRIHIWSEGDFASPYVEKIIRVSLEIVSSSRGFGLWDLIKKILFNPLSFEWFWV